MNRIFISYRRDDSAGHAGRVHDRLEREFGADLIFMDVATIPLGANFVIALKEAVAECEVLLAVIGAGWLNARDDQGDRRLDDPHDFVRIEISAALERGIPVIPILLEDTRIPKAALLPDELKELAFRNGLNVRHASFHSDMDKLINALRNRLATSPVAPVASVVRKDDEHVSAAKIRQISFKGGSSEWDDEVKAIVLAEFSSTGRLIDSAADVEKVPCETWKALDDRVRESYTGLSPTYGFDPALGYVGEAIGFDEKVRGAVFKALRRCLKIDQLR